MPDRQLPRLSPRDPVLSEAFDPAFLARFEVYSYRNASRILAAACAPELAELVETLSAFRIRTEEMVRPGGNKSLIARSMEDLLVPKGWHESRIQGDLVVRKTTAVPATDAGGARRTVASESRYVIEGFIDGHKIDFVKHRVAFDMEWNSKDQTFDRDLYAARTFYECGLIDAAVLLTRSKALAPVFADIASRVSVAGFAAKYGASTTWMGKLLYRLDAGRGGGCPILAIGIKPEVIEDYAVWQAAHPRITRAPAPEDLFADR